MYPSTNFNCLTPAEDERLSILAEEAAEVVQAVMKIQRHGYNSFHPTSRESNRVALEREISDLIMAISNLIVMEDISEANIAQRSTASTALNKMRYSHHQFDLIEILKEEAADEQA